MPVKFFTRLPTHPPFDVIRETNEVEIMFSIPSTPRCDNGTYWMVDNPDMTARGTRFVVTSAIKIAPNIWFNIEKLSKTSPFYKLRHCPSRSICPTCPCSDVGLTILKGYRRLALTNQPFMVVFKKVQKSTDA
ncbi:hypothetical protein K7X08_024726 [Anisodus acutangulus]|uniref:Uncharacterized protein n=1 Tax=Anisodus acutangulus TaxID=402998 RepID=A0A9Q1RG80_9SOLA|nr:hypothetical protein K7X08_024726 [Anisodus acutangulus]